MVNAERFEIELSASLLALLGADGRRPGLVAAAGFESLAAFLGAVLAWALGVDR